MKGLIVGLGSVGTKHVDAAFLSEHSITWYALRHSQDSHSYKGVTNIFDSKNIPEIDFILISNPTSEHYNTIKNFIDLNVPLFIEKPVLSNLKNSEKLLKKIRDKNLNTYVACNLRFHPAINWLHQNIKDIGKIEEVNVYCGSYLPNWRPGRNYKKTYSANQAQGGGVHLDLVHEIDYIYIGYLANLCLLLPGVRVFLI